MKPFLLITGILLSVSLTYSQSKKELEQIVIRQSTEQTALLKEISVLKDKIIDLSLEVSNLKAENERLKTQISSIQAGNTSYGISESPQSKSNNSSAVSLEGGGRCQAITQAGAQCSRKADDGSNYCWQHKSTYEPNKQNLNTAPNASRSSTSSGRTIYTGPRGGRYYINSRGNKVYVK